MKFYFDVAQLYYLPQYIPVYQELTQRGAECRFVLYSNNTLGKALTTEAENLRLPHTIVESVEAAADFYQAEPADWVIFGNEYKYLNRLPSGTRSALINHGAGVKSVGYKEGMNEMDVRFVDGTHHFEQLSKAFPDRNQVLVGFSKLDPLINGEQAKLDLESLGLDPNKKTLLYAPTFYPSSIENFNDEFPAQFEEYNILVKFHFFSYVYPKYQRQLDKLAKWKQYNNVYAAEVSEYNILPFLQTADLLISDASSTLFEFAALNRPVVWCDFLRLRWTYRGPLRFRYRKRMDQKLVQYSDIAVHVKRYSALKENIDHQIQNPSAYEMKRLEYTDKLLGPVDGNAAKRVADYLLSE